MLFRPLWKTLRGLWIFLGDWNWKTRADWNSLWHKTTCECLWKLEQLRLYRDRDVDHRDRWLRAVHSMRKEVFRNTRNFRTAVGKKKYLIGRKILLWPSSQTFERPDRRQSRKWTATKRPPVFGGRGRIGIEDGRVSDDPASQDDYLLGRKGEHDGDGTEADDWRHHKEIADRPSPLQQGWCGELSWLLAFNKECVNNVNTRVFTQLYFGAFLQKVNLNIIMINKMSY